MSSSLVRNWKSFNANTFPYILEADHEFFESDRSGRIIDPSRTLQQHIRWTRSHNTGKSTMHLGLLPTPFLGNLKKAKIFILMLNPGFKELSYLVQHNYRYRSEKLRTLLQSNERDLYPFTPLNPRNALMPGSRYWNGKFNDLVVYLASERRMSLESALQRIAKRVAVLQLIPYHSASTPKSLKKLIRSLQSARDALAFAHGLVRRAKQGEILIIVTRQEKSWGITRSKNVIIYRGAECRSASVSKTSRAWKKMIKMI
jgi:hypothetical protein